MGTKEEPPKRPPKLVKLNTALKLAEQWVSSMSGGTDEEAEELDMEKDCRPAGLGLGAKALPKSQFILSNDPVERRLQKKLNVGRRKAPGEEGSKPMAKKEIDDGSEDDENSDSRTNAFMTKKRTASQTSMVQAKKKQRVEESMQNQMILKAGRIMGRRPLGR